MAEIALVLFLMGLGFGAIAILAWPFASMDPSFCRWIKWPRSSNG